MRGKICLGKSAKIPTREMPLGREGVHYKTVGTLVVCCKTVYCELPFVEFSGQIIVELPIVCIEYAPKKKQDEIPFFDRNFWTGTDIAKFLQNLCTRFFVDLKVLRIA